MKLNELCEILNSMPDKYGNSKVYIVFQDDNGDGDASLLQDISEVAIDVEDDVIVIRAVRY